MAYTDINSEDRLVQRTIAEHLEKALGWESIYAWKDETFGSEGTLGRRDTREVVLVRDLRAALIRLNPNLPLSAIEEALGKLTRSDFSRSLIQHNQEYYRFIRDGVPVSFRDERGELRHSYAKVIDFQNGFSLDREKNNRFVVVRELKITGLKAPCYNRRADLVCFVNGLPLVFFELKAVYKNIRAGFDGNLSDYLDENVIAHAFHHNAFLVVSNGHRARYGSITSKWEHFYEWKRSDEKQKGDIDTKFLLDGMLAHDRLLDLVENFILFDASKPGSIRKVVARNHQVLGVNNAVDSVRRQEDLKKLFPPDKRLGYRVIELPKEDFADHDSIMDTEATSDEKHRKLLSFPESAHPDLGKLGVFWHTQGSGKSYSMLFFAEKVRRQISAKFTFLIMTDRNDLDSQIYRTFIGTGVAEKGTPRTSTGDELERLLKENHRYIFSLIHKFNKDVDPLKPYSSRDDIIVISDEAHRTQTGKLARNMRVALPNAAFIGFTGTPLFKNDHLTKRIFGGYISRYDFKRSEEDGSTTKLVYENRGEKLGIARLDLNDKISDAIDKAELDPDKEALLEKLLGQDYEVITADDRLDKVASDFVEHATARWESGKSLLVCIDKITCARMYQRIIPRWKAKLEAVKKAAAIETQIERRQYLEKQSNWLEETIIEMIISESQNEVADFKKWNFDIIPHRGRMKQGFEIGDERVDVESAFKNPEHPFRIAIVCAMWLTGFDVECLSTLYIDKHMKAHTLMQAIARANRVYPGKDFGLIVDYNGMLKSLREALAQYALGDDNSTDEEIVVPIEERVDALRTAIEETEKHLNGLGFEVNRLNGAKGFPKIEALADAVEVVYTSDESKRRFEIMARLVFIRFKALVTEPAVYTFAERHDNIEAIYKKLQERRDTADVSSLLKELHKIINNAIATQDSGNDKKESKRFDLSMLDLEALRDEFSKKAKRKATAIQDIFKVVEDKLALMLKDNPQRMDYYKKYSEIIADYNREKDRITIEETFAQLMGLANSLDAEQRRATEEGLTEEELALFDLLTKENLSPSNREKVKQASRQLLESVLALIEPLEQWTEKERTKAEVESHILDSIYLMLPSPLFNAKEQDEMARRVYQHIWQQSASGQYRSLRV
ncbi:MAG: type I restriction endonuclease subunit R [Verrucomicrobia bacterium]|nr:type I restriction endonuclease subunit R [Verrucomicrobiota bacterium]